MQVATFCYLAPVVSQLSQVSQGFTPRLAQPSPGVPGLQSLLEINMPNADNESTTNPSPCPEGPRAELAEQAAGEIELLAMALLERRAELPDDLRFAGVLLARIRDLSRIAQTALAPDGAGDFETALADFEAGH